MGRSPCGRAGIGQRFGVLANVAAKVAVEVIAEESQNARLSDAGVGRVSGRADTPILNNKVVTHAHAVVGNTGSTNPAHTHSMSFNSGSNNVSHTHAYSGTTGTDSPDHNHDMLGWVLGGVVGIG